MMFIDHVFLLQRLINDEDGFVYGDDYECVGLDCDCMKGENK